MGSVLVVEDDVVTLVAMTMLLEAEGHDVSAETTVAGAVRRLRTDATCFELVVLDHDLPDGTGAEIAAVAAVLLPRARIVMHTSRRLEVLPEGVDRLVAKAPGLDPLLEVLHAA